MAIDKKSWERFMNQLRIELPGSSDAGITEKLFDVLDEFCDYSGSWQETLTAWQWTASGDKTDMIGRK